MLLSPGDGIGWPLISRPKPKVGFLFAFSICFLSGMIVRRPWSEVPNGFEVFSASVTGVSSFFPSTIEGFIEESSVVSENDCVRIWAFSEEIPGGVTEI